MDAQPNHDVCVIVRCYNEAPVVAQVIEGLRHEFAYVVGVDDGSDDGSGEAMREVGAWVVRHEINLGAGAALQTGLEYALLNADFNYFVCFDADGQHRVSDAASMVERIRVEPLDVLVGSRFLGTAVGMTRSRKWLLKIGRNVERLSTGVRLTDAHNGLRVFSRRFASQVDLQSSDMAYASELLSQIKRSGLAYAEHPVTIDYSDYSRGKGQRSVNAVNIVVDVWLMRLFGRGRR